MDVLNENPVEAIKNIALALIKQIEDGQDHSEIWQKIAALKSPNEQAMLRELTLYFSQLLMVPQSQEAFQLIAALEAVCVAYNGNPALAIQKLDQLTHQYPSSLLINGALNFLRQDQAISPKTDLTAKMLNDLMTAQTVTNKALLTQMHLTRQAVESVNALQQRLHDVQQTLHWVTRNIPRKKNHRIRCVFLVSYFQSWDALADVYDEMKASQDFEVIVASTVQERAQHTRQPFGEDLNHQFLEAAGIPHIRFDTAAPSDNSMDVLKALEPDIIFRQTQWLDLPPRFNAEDINFARLCYIPYAVATIKRFDKSESADSDSSVKHSDMPYHRLCWRIFCETELHKEMYAKAGMRGGDNLVVTGYPKFDRLVKAKERAPFWPITQAKESRRLRVIWAPHHSVSPEIMGFGTFVKVHQEMLEWAKQSENEIEFVLKPHPALMSELVYKQKLLTQDYMDSYYAAWNALPNTAFLEDGDYGPLFVGSDVMLTDGVSFLTEYQLFEKPVIFIDSGHHMGFNLAGEVIVESVNTVKTISEARELCMNFKNGMPDPMREKQKQLLSKIMPYPGRSAKKIVQMIREGLAAEGVISLI